MRLALAPLCLVAVTLIAAAQPRAPQTSKVKPSEAPAAAPSFVKDLPVRKVVLYKNGVGYFEHAGAVTGNQRVAIDFTSAQLNDVLQSLTILDEGGGRIAGVNYNSTTPLAEQLKSLSLGMGDNPTSTELFQALRGQRVEVTGGPGGPITGRLMSIESRTEKTGAGDDTVDKFYLTLVAASGAVRVIELTPTLSVRPLDANLQGQLDRYLELLSSNRSTGLRHLTLNAIGQGQRDLRVSYISEGRYGNLPTASSFRAPQQAARAAMPSCRAGPWSTTPSAPTGTTCNSLSWPALRRALFSRYRSRSTRAGQRFPSPPASRQRRKPTKLRR